MGVGVGDGNVEPVPPNPRVAITPATSTTAPKTISSTRLRVALCAWRRGFAAGRAAETAELGRRERLVARLCDLPRLRLTA